MTDGPTGTSATWLRVAGGFGLLWNLYGVYKFLAAIGLIGAAGAPMPNWVIVVFGVGAFAGALGGLCLLMLSRWATALLVVAMVANFAWDARLLAGGDRLSPLGLAAAVTLVGIVLAGISWFAEKQGRLH